MPGYEDHGPRIGKLVNANYIPHFLEIADDFEDDVVLLLDQKAVNFERINCNAFPHGAFADTEERSTWLRFGKM